MSNNSECLGLSQQYQELVNTEIRCYYSNNKTPIPLF